VSEAGQSSHFFQYLGGVLSANLTDVENAAFKHRRTIGRPSRSSNPADPLNWPVWRKTALLVVASLYAFVANFLSSSPAPALSRWNASFPHDPRTYPELTHLIAVR
jgi:hypothetical protein